jgi:hypothetical protein
MIFIKIQGAISTKTFYVPDADLPNFNVTVTRLLKEDERIVFDENSG